MNITPLSLLQRSRRMIQRARKAHGYLSVARPSAIVVVVESRVSPPYPQTPKSANAWFIRHGVCKARWAKAQGFDRMTVSDLLRGRLKGLRGEAHRAALALGLKANPASSHSAAA